MSDQVRPGRQPAPLTAAERVYAIQHDDTMDGLLYIISSLRAPSDLASDLAPPGWLDIFTVNLGEAPQPADITVDDQAGHRVDVVSPAGPVPGRSVRHQIVPVAPEFQRSGATIRTLDSKDTRRPL